MRKSILNSPFKRNIILKYVYMSAVTTNSGNSSDGNSPTSPNKPDSDNASGGLAGMLSGVADPSGAPTKDASGVDASGVDASGVDPSGIIGFYKKIWHSLGLNKIGDPFDTAGAKIGGVFIMFIIAFTSSIVPLLFFLCSQNLTYLTSAKHLASLPTNIKKTPYAKVEGGPTGIMYGYGAPYSFRDDPTVIPWVPCNYPRLRNLFGIKKWFGETCLYSWLYGRKLLKVVLEGLSGLPEILKMIFAFPIMGAMVGLGGLVTIIFTFVGSFQSSVLWGILGIIFAVFPILLFFLGLFQHLALVYYLFISPITTAAGRQHLADSIHKHKTLLSLVYISILLCLSPLFLGGWWTLGMVAGILLFGFS